jgi:uncharacterized membrane protein YeaQ/YmgE (transglycosylase-associated protein family)
MDQQTRNLVYIAGIGIVAGYLASVVLGGSGLIRYLVSGVMGAFVGPFILDAVKIDLGIRNLLVRQLATATIGAIIVVIAARLIG